MRPPPPSRAGSSARHLRSMQSAVTASVRRVFSPVSRATVVALSEHGSWSGTVWSSVSSSQRILSLWLERLSTDRIVRQWREAPSPLAVFGKGGNLDLLVAVDAAAERLGLTAGLALAQARAMHPALTAMPEDQAADARLLEALADGCQRYPPLLAADPPDGILLDIGGCAHLFGGEEKLRDDLLARMTGFGFTARAAIAASIGAASAAARFSEAAITPTDDERDLLGPLPLAALRLSSDTVAALARVGLKRIGDILDLPRAPLAARFGAALFRMLYRALGARPLAQPRPRSGAQIGAADSTPAGRALYCRKELSRTDRTRRGRPRDRRAACDAAEGGAGGARGRCAPPRTCPFPHRRRGQAHRGRHLAPGARSAGDPRALCRAARRAWRRDRSGLRLRSGAAFRDHRRALSGRADRSRRTRRSSRARSPRRPPERAAPSPASVPPRRPCTPYPRA